MNRIPFSSRAGPGVLELGARPHQRRDEHVSAAEDTCMHACTSLYESATTPHYATLPIVLIEERQNQFQSVPAINVAHNRGPYASVLTKALNGNDAVKPDTPLAEAIRVRMSCCLRMCVHGNARLCMCDCYLIG